MERLIGVLGIVVILFIAFLLSNNKKAINYKTIGIGLALQFMFAIFIFKVPVGQKIFLTIGHSIEKLLEIANIGGAFVFGPFVDNKTLSSIFGEGTMIFAAQLISATIFMMMLVNILYYYGIMQRVVTVLGKAMNKIMKVSGAEALSNVASAFVGQVTAQIMIISLTY